MEVFQEELGEVWGEKSPGEYIGGILIDIHIMNYAPHIVVTKVNTYIQTVAHLHGGATT